MTRIICFLIVLIGVNTDVLSQNSNLNDYSYIIVPTKFDFLQEEDQFQINSMTKFFLNKYGFNAMFNTEVPDNARRCDGLWADVIKSSGLVYTKLEVVIKDCKGNELYRSNEGKSKYKHYQKAYQDALRKAFMSFQNLNVSQPEMVVYKEEGFNNNPTLKETNKKEINDIPTKEVIIVSGSNKENDAVNLPDTEFTTYTNQDSFYVLRKKKDRYAFYLESGNGDLILKGTFSSNGTDLIYEEILGKSYDVSLDDLGNISIYFDGKTMIYLRSGQ